MARRLVEQTADEGIRVDRAAGDDVRFGQARQKNRFFLQPAPVVNDVDISAGILGHIRIGNVVAVVQQNGVWPTFAVVEGQEGFEVGARRSAVVAYPQDVAGFQPGDVEAAAGGDDGTIGAVCPAFAAVAREAFAEEAGIPGPGEKMESRAKAGYSIPRSASAST